VVASVAIGPSEPGRPRGDTGVTRLRPQRHPGPPSAGHVPDAHCRRRDARVGIDTGDLVLIDRAIPPSHGHVVIAVVDDEFVCRQLARQGDGLRLQAPGAGCADILAREGDGVPGLGRRHPGHQGHARLSGRPGSAPCLRWWT
jgi:DNA polymerase V